MIVSAVQADVRGMALFMKGMVIPMKKALVDLHTHTIASGHAFSTLKENLEEAREVGLAVLGLSDHAMSVPGAANKLYFQNLKLLPERIGGIRLLHGVEVNIMDYEGTLDMDETLLKEMDYVIASLHVICVKPGTREENTEAILGALENPGVKIIGHPDDGRYPLDVERVVKRAQEKQAVLELNNSSLRTGSHRQNSRENSREILECARKYNVPILMGSDSHICYHVGKFEQAEELLSEVGFPPELVLNYHPEKLDIVMNQGHKL